MQLQLYGKKIWLYRSAVDFRRSIDGLTHLVLNNMKHQPKEGILRIIMIVNTNYYRW